MALHLVSLPTQDNPYAAAFLCDGCLGAFNPKPSNRPSSAKVPCDNCGAGRRLQRAKRLREAWHKRLWKVVRRG